ncbi:MAG: aminoglycoside phosphotransferase (APT) family kinase protein [Candidatus Promineifilaceae bacterium]|jgi:aminoglycoside phosphotransferase (APT) family kinase protein
MDEHFTEITLNATGASALAQSDVIQSLWSGYGTISRCGLEGAERESVVVKHVHWPTADHHPRGWNTGRSHERKVKSYQVETAFYRDWAGRCDDACRVPACLALETRGDEVFMVMEDLDAAGYDRRLTHVSDDALLACISWMANFHAAFMDDSPTNLWPIGTYWHLATRPDELAALDDQALKAAAPAIDAALNATPFQTLVHGDMKLANFCFSSDNRVAAVDFQYVGGGCGMKDLAYFISSCLDEKDCERRESALLDFYFHALRAALASRDKSLDFAALESDWRALYPVAWTDFFRFLQGWSPGHWKIHSYSERLSRDVLDGL